MIRYFKELLATLKSIDARLKKIEETQCALRGAIREDEGGRVFVASGQNDTNRRAR